MTVSMAVSTMVVRLMIGMSMMRMVMVRMLMRFRSAVAVLGFFWIHQVMSARVRMSACATAQEIRLSPIKQ